MTTFTDSSFSSTTAKTGEGDSSAHSPHTSANPGFPTGDPVTFLPKNSRGGIRRLVASFAHLADLQFSIWATEAKIAMMRIAIVLVLVVAAMIAAILGTIAIFIGIFHVLTDLLHIPVVWAHLIMGAGWLIGAVILFLIARNMVQRSITSPRTLRSARP